jgi:hypothetical protein
LTAVFNLLIPVLAGGAALAGIYFMVRALLTDRSAESRAPYELGKQRAHHEMQIDLVRSVFSFIVALILLGVFGLTPRTVSSSPDTPTATPEQVTAVFTAPATSQATATTAVILPTLTLVPTLPASPTAAQTTPSPTPLPANTATPEPRTATVSSGVGVYLRAEPGTQSEQLEWLLAGTILIVLAETATAENLAWQRVQTQEGIVGWVAVPFITYNDQP